MAAVLMSRYDPGAYPSSPLQTGLLESRPCLSQEMMASIVFFNALG